MSYNNRFIPLHVVEEILLNLDAQTLIQCISVCRDWNSLITSPDFISRHSNRTLDDSSRKEILFIKCVQHKKIKLARGGSVKKAIESYSLHLDNDQFDLLRTLKEIPPIRDRGGKQMVGYSNGLICLADSQVGDFVLLNPTIQRYVLLPRHTMSEGVRILSLGFGFDPRNNDFKLVKLVSRNPYILDSAWVFSYVTSSWKHITDSTPPCVIHVFAPHVSINGVLHWIASSTVRKCGFVLTFDMARQVFGEISLPCRDLFSIVAAGDTIAAARKSKYLSCDTPIWPLWVMKQYGVHESWERVIKTNELDPRSVLGIRKNGDIILEMRAGRIMTYNPSTLKTSVQVVAGLGLKTEIAIGYHAENLYLLDKGEQVNSN